jgi:hypothetical protein
MGEFDNPIPRDLFGRTSPERPVIVPEFIVKDSGERKEYNNGFVRDIEDNKTDLTQLFGMSDLDLIPQAMLERWIEHMRKGAVKYGRNNWTKARGEEAVDRFKRSAARHMNQWLRGDTDEDHVSAIVFNVWAAEEIGGNDDD